MNIRAGRLMPGAWIVAVALAAVFAAVRVTGTLGPVSLRW
jgi:hypothetical protein